MLKYGSQSTDIIRQMGSSLRVTTVNAKGSWCREMIEGREVSQVELTPRPDVAGATQISPFALSDVLFYLLFVLNIALEIVCKELSATT